MDSSLQHCSWVVQVVVPSVSVVVGLLVLSLALLLRYLQHLRHVGAARLTDAWKRRNTPGIWKDGGNGRVLRETTLAVTDVEGSTELWESMPSIMTQAQEVHDSVMRQLIGRYCGHEVSTEGDSFTVAFHDAFDAVCWALALQQAMLEADWPEALLAHEKAATVHSSAADSSRPGQLLFRGLRVRVAIATGVPSKVYAHELTQSPCYAGPVVDLVMSLSDLPAGGQVLLEPEAYNQVASRLVELGACLAGSSSSSSSSNSSRSSSVQALAQPAKGRGQWQVAMAEMPLVNSRLEHSKAQPQRKPWWGRLRGHGTIRRSSTLNAANSLQKLVGSSILSVVPPPSSPTARDLEAGRAPQAGRGTASMLASLRRRASILSPDGATDEQPDAAAALAAAAAAVQDDEHVPMLISLGSHWLDGQGSTSMATLHGSSLMQGVQLTQITTRQLAARAAHFPALPSPRQILPSYFQAPAAASALLPDGMLFAAGSQLAVTMVFVAPADMKQLQATTSSAAAVQAEHMFRSAVRTMLAGCHGYEAQERDGVFMLAFADPGDALEWACVLNLALMCVHWAPEVLASPAAAEVHSPTTGELLHRGIRPRIGIYRGALTRIIPHGITGRADYFGPAVNRAARFLAASQPGQVLADAELVAECVTRWGTQEHQAALHVRAMQSNSSTSTERVPSRGLSGKTVSSRAAGSVLEAKATTMQGTEPGTAAEMQQQQQQQQQQNSGTNEAAPVLDAELLAGFEECSSSAGLEPTPQSMSSAGVPAASSAQPSFVSRVLTLRARSNHSLAGSISSAGRLRSNSIGHDSRGQAAQHVLYAGGQLGEPGGAVQRARGPSFSQPRPPAELHPLQQLPLQQLDVLGAMVAAGPSQPQRAMSIDSCCSTSPFQQYLQLLQQAQLPPEDSPQQQAQPQQPQQQPQQGQLQQQPCLLRCASRSAVSTMTGAALSASIPVAPHLSDTLTGALPLEALPAALHLTKMSRQQVLMRAIKRQVTGASVPPTVPLHIQVFDHGEWRFKGVPGSHRVCLVVPTLLARRLQQPLGKPSSKATCVQPAGGLQHGLWVEVLNLNCVLVDPALLAANAHICRRGSGERLPAEAR